MSHVDQPGRILLTTSTSASPPPRRSLSDLHQLLRHRWPACFGGSKSQCRRPLKVGIDQDILADTAFLAEHQLTAKHIRVALAAWTNTPRYQQALVTGATRVDLDGRPAGIVFESEAQRASLRLAHIVEQRRTREQARKPAEAAKAAQKQPPTPAKLSKRSESPPTRRSKPSSSPTRLLVVLRKRRRLRSRGLAVNRPLSTLNGLSPNAHGTLLALRDLGEDPVVRRLTAAELIERGYAERVHDGLRVTETSHSFRPFGQRRTRKEKQPGSARLGANPCHPTVTVGC